MPMHSTVMVEPMLSGVLADHLVEHDHHEQRRGEAENVDQGTTLTPSQITGLTRVEERRIPFDAAVLREPVRTIHARPPSAHLLGRHRQTRDLDDVEDRNQALAARESTTAWPATAPATANGVGSPPRRSSVKSAVVALKPRGRPAKVGTGSSRPPSGDRGPACERRPR